MLLLGVLGGLIQPKLAWALRPMSHTLALVAGDGTAGFRDGDFTTAFFNLPSGLAVDPEGTRLYVADFSNNSIRVIHLDQNNTVTTLNARGSAGNQDGPLTTALFNQPRDLLYLSGNRLLINDFGNALLRLIDLKSSSVTTLAGNAPTTLSEGPALQVSMAGIWNLVYLPSTDSVVFSQPDLGTLKKLDLKTGQVTLVLDHSTAIPHPAALCVTGGVLYAADRDLLQVYSLGLKTSAPPDLTPAALAVTQVMALSGTGENLYALQAGDHTPLQRLLPRTEAVTFLSVWGDAIPDPGLYLPTFVHQGNLDSIGFIPDPRDDRSFFISTPRLNIVSSYRDLTRNLVNGILESAVNAKQVSGLDYPLNKPKGTYRILLVGDSHSAWVDPFAFTSNGYKNDHTLSLSKRLELQLNTLAALDDQTLHFEVLNLTRIAAAPLFLWPTYDVPPAVKAYDIDLVMILQVPCNYEADYFQRPTGPDGIPSEEVDSEYLMKPALERIPDGEPRRFYDLCKARNLVNLVGNNLFFGNCFDADKDVRDSLVQLYGKPLDLLNHRLASMRTSNGKPVRLMLCFTPTAFYVPHPEFEKVWEDVAHRFDVPFLDLYKEMTALRISFSPMSETRGEDHFDSNGHFFMGMLLAHDLLRDGLIPWRMDGSSIKKSR
jgi:hypothetical protein